MSADQSNAHGGFRFEVEATLDMTRGGYASLLSELREYCDVDDHEDVIVVSGTIEEIAGQIGDCGPEEAIRNLCGVPENGDLSDDAVSLMNALAFEEWWSDMNARIEEHGATVNREPEAV